MKKIILSAFLALFMAGSAFAETVRMGTEGAYPPYNFINDNGEVDGFERDVGDTSRSTASAGAATGADTTAASNARLDADDA